VVVLGDMLELGAFETQGHNLVGIRAAEIADVIVAVGELGRLIGQAAAQAGHRRVYFAGNNDEAVAVVREVTQPGDYVLVKGSRGAQMEDIVAALAQDTESHGATH
jgi:UDP-N-acetylmuramoyl-tripeptide--D-alanyl-D-alanine ligase